MTARDSARLALLYANGGMFDGKRLLPKDWVGYVSSTRGAQPENPRTPRYGAGFWVLDSRQGPPSGTFAMEGSRGQYAIIGLPRTSSSCGAASIPWMRVSTSTASHTMRWVC